LRCGFLIVVALVATYLSVHQAVNDPQAQLRVVLGMKPPPPADVLRENPSILIIPIILWIGVAVDLASWRFAGWLNCGIWGAAACYSILVVLTSLHSPHLEHVIEFGMFFGIPILLVLAAIVLFYWPLKLQRTH